jgi:hypothetical protein
MPKKKKIPFVLLELLIGFALVSTCILPFLRFPYLALKKELELLFQMEFEKKAQIELVHFQADLMSHHIDKDILFDKKMEPFRQEIPSCAIILTHSIKRKVDIVRTVFAEKQKEGKDQKTYSLLNIQIDIYPYKKRIHPITSAKSYLIAETK